MSTLENLKAARAAIAGLKKILKDCDPASGVSFSVRRGVSRDNDDSPDDAIKRPWVTVEISDTKAGEALGVLLSAMAESEVFWTRALSRDIEEAQKYLSATGGAK